MNFFAPERVLAALCLLACLVMLVRLAVGERRRARIDAFGQRLVRGLQAGWARLRSRRPGPARAGQAPRPVPRPLNPRSADLRTMRPPRPPRATGLRLVETPGPKNEAQSTPDAAREAQALIERVRRAKGTPQRDDGGSAGV